MNTNTAGRWAEARLLAEARKRTAQLTTDNASRVQEMLDTLLKEAGWTDADFIDALCQDVINRKGKKPASGPGPKRATSHVRLTAVSPPKRHHG